MLASIVLLTGAFPASNAMAKTTKSQAKARVHATLRLSQNVLGIEVTIPTLLYTVENQATSALGTAIDANRYDVEVQAGDVLYCNTLDLPLAVYYTVTAEDVASGTIHISVLS